MPIWPFVVLATPVVAAVVALAAKRDRKRHLALMRKFRQAPLLKVAELVPGSVARVRGRVETYANTLVVPFTDRECVHYEVRGLAFDEAKGAYDDVLLEAKGVPFWIVDDSGRVLVTAGPLERLLVRESFGDPDVRATREQATTRFGRDVRSGVIASLEPGEEAVAFGRVELDTPARHMEADRGYREASTPSPRIAIVPRKGVTRLISDVPSLVRAPQPRDPGD